MSGLEARLQRLEQAVSRLQSQLGGGEQLSPNYLTLDPQGRVGATFSGLIQALGLIIPESTSGALALPNAIEWQDTGGVVREVIEGQSSTAGVHRLAMLAQEGSFLAQFTAQVAFQSTLRADTEAAGVQIIAADGTSDLVQWGSGTTNAKIQAGTFTFVLNPNGAAQATPIPLAVAWPHNHFVFVASANPQQTWTGVSQGNYSEVRDLSSGWMTLYNVSISQTFICNWISFGN